MNPRATISAVSLGPDPITTPADVPSSSIVRIPDSLHVVEAPIQGIMLAAVGGGPITVQLYAVESQAWSVPKPTADSVFVAIGEATSVVQDKYVSVAESIGSGVEFPLVPPSGYLYIRVTAGNGAGRSVKVAYI